MLLATVDGQIIEFCPICQRQEFDSGISEKAFTFFPHVLYLDLVYYQNAVLSCFSTHTMAYIIYFLDIMEPIQVT
jgi:hypothetical protein